MRIRLGTLEDIPALALLMPRIVPLMRAAGNLQWDENYPNPEVFARDVQRGQLWVVEIDGAVAGVVALTSDPSQTTYRQIGTVPSQRSSCIV